MVPRSRRTAWIAWNDGVESDDPPDTYRVHWEERVDNNPAFERGPEQASLEEALAWARANADRVRLRTPEGEFSAGAERVGRLPVWDEAR